MIDKLVIHKNEIKNNGDFSFIADSDLFKNKKLSENGESLEIKFSQGLNILIGKNGSGKSSILKLIGNALAAHQGGYSSYTDSWCMGVSLSKSLVGFDLHHDNQPIMYFDATHVVGTIGGSFDDDFFQEGISYITNKGSSGQKSGSRLNSILSVMAYGEGFPLKFAGEEKINSRRTRNDKLDESIKQIEKHIISKSQKTIILDEPENHLDLKSTIGFWKLVHHFLKRHSDYQVIISSHSHLVFSPIFSYANFIEMTDNYLKETKDTLIEFENASRR